MTNYDLTGFLDRRVLDHSLRPDVFRRELATAIESAFVVINKNDLPQVDTESDPGWIVAGTSVALPGTEPKSVHKEARELLALALHLEANPPIDAEQVQRIRDAVTRADRNPPADYIRSDQIGRHVAEALYKEGVRVP